MRLVPLTGVTPAQGSGCDSERHTALQPSPSIRLSSSHSSPGSIVPLPQTRVDSGGVGRGVGDSVGVSVGVPVDDAVRVATASALGGRRRGQRRGLARRAGQGHAGVAEGLAVAERLAVAEGLGVSGGSVGVAVSDAVCVGPRVGGQPSQEGVDRDDQLVDAHRAVVVDVEGRAAAERVADRG